MFTQETRISHAVEVMVRHVDNLKRMYEREHQELEETRRVLQENRLMGDQPLNNRGLAGLALGGGKVSACLHASTLSVYMCKKDMLSPRIVATKAMTMS